MTVPEAPLERAGQGIEATGEGWFVLNLRDARWFEVEGSSYAPLEGEHVRFPQIGVHVDVLQPGQPNCMYHRESVQEGFLVLAGEGILVVEGQERPLRQWDFVHCPSGTNHVLVGAGDGPFVFVSVGYRPVDEIVYPVDETALRHGAGVEQETTVPAEAYAGVAEPTERAFRPGDLPAW